MFRDRCLRTWPIADGETWFEDYYPLGHMNNPFDLRPYGITYKALGIVNQLLRDDHTMITTLTLEEVKECDKVVEELGLDKYRARYFYRSRNGD